MDKSNYEKVKRELKRLGFDSDVDELLKSRESASSSEKITPLLPVVPIREINREQRLFPDMPIRAIAKDMRDSLIATLKGKKRKGKGREI